MQKSSDKCDSMFNLSFDKVTGGCAAFFLFAFYFFSALSDLVHYQGSVFTIGFRLLVIVLTLFYFCWYVISRKKILISTIESFVLVILLCFLIFYTLALLRGMVNLESFSLKEIDYIVWMFLICFFHSFIFTSVGKFDIKSFIFVGTFFLFLIVSLTLFNYYNVLSSGEYISARVQSERVNPIAFGHSSVSLAILSLIAIERKILTRFYFILFILAFIFTVLSGSKGALISLFSVLIIYFSMNSTFKFKLFLLTCSIFLCVIYIYIVTVFFDSINIPIVDSLINLGSVNDKSSNTRVDLISNALNQFENRPIFGDYIEERYSSFYPHNIIVEVLMATGMVGMILFCVSFTFLLSKCLVLIKQRGLACIFALLFLQYFIASFFSGAIFANYSLWYLTVAILFIPIYTGRGYSARSRSFSLT